MPEPRSITLTQFRRIPIFSGELRVVGRSRRRRGVSFSAKPGPAQPRNAAALASSQAHDAATRDANRQNAGGVATSGNATASFGLACAGAARGRRVQPKDTPSPHSADATKPSGKKKTSTSGGDGGDHGGPEKPSDESLSGERVNLQGGPELPANGWEFLRAVNARIDIVRLTELILRSSDEKLVASVGKQLLDLAYKRNERTPSQLPDPDFFDIPRPVRD